MNIKSVLISLVVLSLCLSGCGTTAPHTNGTSKAKPGTVLWEFQTEGPDRMSSPAIGSDGTIYIGSGNGKVYALNGRTGAKIWEFETGGHNALKGATVPPAIGADGTVYIGSEDHWVYALDGKTGAKIWEFKTGSHLRSSPAIGTDGTVYVGSGDDKVYALEGKTGAKIWEFELGDVFNSPYLAIGAGGTVYVLSDEHEWSRTQPGGITVSGGKSGKLYALDGKTGAKKWHGFFGKHVQPVIGADGILYISAAPHWLYALDGKTGAKIWRIGSRSSSAKTNSYYVPAIGADGTLYGSGIWRQTWVFYALDGKTGAKKWNIETGDDRFFYPAIGDDGTIYVGSRNGKIYALDGKTGAKRWEIKTGWRKDKFGNTIRGVSKPPVIGADCTLYVSAKYGKVYAIKTASKGPAKSPWPMRGSNAQNTANVNKVNPPKGDTPVVVAKKPTPPKPDTPKPSVRPNYNGSKADLIKLFMTGDPKAAWVLGEKAPNKVEKYKWWNLANVVSISKGQGPYRPAEIQRQKVSLTSPNDQQAVNRWLQHVLPITSRNVGKPLKTWLKELQPHLPR